MQNTTRAVSKLRSFPKLYNAKRQIEVSRGLLPEQLAFFKKNPLSEVWRTQVSQDVVDFMDKIEARDENGNPTNELLPQEKIRIFQNPSQYFSRPHNVPTDTRKQIYFPDFGVTLLRTPHLGPYYAQFDVPLWFSKLDLKSYLKNLYDVDVNHIRSFVVHAKQARRNPSGRYTQGQQYQPAFTKKMTVHLVEPFIWPEQLSEKDLNTSDYAKREYWKSAIEGYGAAREEQEEFKTKPDLKHRRSIAEQARALLSGQMKWQPTWQHMPQDVRVLQGRSKSEGLVAGSNSLSPFR